MRLAFFSPLSPKPSGIADYADALLPHLAARVESLDVFIEDYQTDFRSTAQNLRVRHWREFEPDYEAGCYDAVLYHLGNNPFHVYIYDLAVRIPGVVVLHEFGLHHLLAAVTISRGDWDAYLRELEHDAGSEALQRGLRAREGLEQLDYENVAMNRSLIERSRGLIVHSDYVGGLVSGAGFQLPVRKILHGVDTTMIEPSSSRRVVERLAGFSLDDTTQLFGVFGFLKPYKRIREALYAFARVRAEHPGIRMILVGEEHPHYPLRETIEELGLGDAVRILGYVPLETFTTCLAACDICINLRRPTVGETSGSFLRALALGKPALISEIGAFQEIPGDVAVKIPVDDREIDWVAEYMKVLLRNPDLTAAIGERARAYAERECSWPKVTAQYAEFLAQSSQDSEAPAASVAGAGEGVSANVEAGGRSALQATTAELEEYIMGFSHASPLMEEYALQHRKRLARTVEITPPGSAQDRILELGCYLQITPALRKFLGYGEVRGAYYGPVGKTEFRSTKSSEGEVFTCPVDLFDAEKDRYPYPDGYFRTVLCCELIEHLPSDPMHLMAEINRVLASGGYFFLSTPNITSFRSVSAVLNGYHPGLFPAYIKPSADGTVDPRHAREYAPREMVVLMEAAGFQVELLETGSYGEPDQDTTRIEQFLRKNQCSFELRGDVIYCLGRKTGAVRERWPKELYYPP